MYVGLWKKMYCTLVGWWKKCAPLISELFTILTEYAIAQWDQNEILFLCNNKYMYWCITENLQPNALFKIFHFIFWSHCASSTYVQKIGMHIHTHLISKSCEKESCLYFSEKTGSLVFLCILLKIINFTDNFPCQQVARY